MTAVQTRQRRAREAVQSDSPVEPAPAAAVAEALIPAHLLDGGEIVVFAIKPSLWFIVLVSAWWIAGTALLWVAAMLAANSLTLPLMQLAVALLVARLAWATMQWSTRLYVLTNRRVMLIRGVFTVELFECPLTRIQNTWMTLSPAERILRLGSIHMSTAAGAGAGGVATWQTVPRPLEVHEKLRSAIARAQNRGGNGL
jgi:uncharacterized membrane protein YdbT with pleckstrin-like domain